MRASGTGKRALTTARGRDAAWSLDGKSIAYVDREIYVVAATGGQPRRLTHERGLSLTSLSWQGGTTIAYRVNDCCFLGGVPFSYSASVTLAGRQVDNWNETECEYRSDCPVVAPDGRHRFVITREHPRNGPWNVQLMGDDIQPLDLGQADTYGFSTTGRYAMWAAGKGLVVANANATHQVLLPTAGFVQWSPTDAYLAVRDGSSISVAAGDGTDVHAVATGVSAGVAGSGLWSGHGTWVVLTTEGSGGSVTTTVLRPDGAGAHVLVRWHVPVTRKNYGYDPTWSSPSWAPNDAWAAYYDTCGRGFAVYRVDAPSGSARRLTQCR